MIRTFLLGFAAAAMVTACAPVPGTPDVERGPRDIDGYSLLPELVERSQPGPPSTIPGECWTHQTLPAVIETVTEHRETAPGVFQSDTHQQIVQRRRHVWFRTPCPAEMTPDFIASVQRALKARGLYQAPLTGEMDTPTREAIRRYQAALGLDNEVLSLGAAKQLGLVSYSLWDLKTNQD